MQTIFSTVTFLCHEINFINPSESVTPTTTADTGMYITLFT